MSYLKLFFIAFLLMICSLINCEESKSVVAITFNNWIFGTGVFIWLAYFIRMSFYRGPLYHYQYSFFNLPPELFDSCKQAIYFSFAPFFYTFFNFLLSKLPFFDMYSNGSFLPSRKIYGIDLSAIEGIYFVMNPQKNGFVKLLATNILAEFLPSYVRILGSFLYAGADLFLNFLCICGTETRQMIIGKISNIGNHSLNALIRFSLKFFIFPHTLQYDYLYNSKLMAFIYTYKILLSISYPILLCHRYLISEIKEGFAAGEGMRSIFEEIPPAFQILYLPPLPSDYALPSISELAALPSSPCLPTDERIQHMADRMQARAESIKGDLESIFAYSMTTVSVPSSGVSSASSPSLNLYGGTRGGVYFALFTEKVIMPELIAYFRSLQEKPHINEDSLERFLRVIGKLRFYIAVKTASTDPQDFGFLMHDYNSKEAPLIFDPMHAFPNWYNYYTKSILGDEFAYPFEEPPVQFVQRPFFFINSYCWHVVQNSGEITRRFLAAYKDFHLVDGPSSAIVRDEPEVHFIVHPLDLAFIPNFTVFHAPFSPSHFKELLPLLLAAIQNPTLENVARVHYYINVRSFYRRGQAAITLWLLTALFALDGKKLVLDAEMTKTGVNLDMFALLHLKFEDYLAFLTQHASLVPLI